MSAKLTMFEGHESIEAAAKSLALELSKSRQDVECVDWLLPLPPIV